MLNLFVPQPAPKNLRPPENPAPSSLPQAGSWPQHDMSAADHWDEEFFEDDEFELDE